MRSVAAKGRLVAYTSEAQAGRLAARRRNALAEAAWKTSDQPEWLTERVYFRDIQPRLSGPQRGTTGGGDPRVQAVRG
jgi:hypothetical protein